LLPRSRSARGTCHLWRWTSRILLTGILCGVSACQSGQVPPPVPSAPTSIPVESSVSPFFTDVTAESGVAFTYRNGEEANHYTILESLGGGAALLDYDGDGLLDLFLTGGGYFDGPERPVIRGYANRLYKNLGGWKFRDVTAAVGLDQPVFYTHGAAVGDYDNDGWPDLLVTGWGRLALYHNANDSQGGRRFVEVTQPAGLTDKLWSTSAAWADVDGDGFADLYVCHYVDWSFDQKHPVCAGAGVPRDICSPKSFKGLPDTLYHNNGNGTFTEVSAQAGLRPEGKALGVLVVDLNDDGRPDIYVANDQVENYLYVNQGQGRFTEKGLLCGVALDDKGRPNGSMGVDTSDYDGSGRPSLWVTNFEYELHALYHNLGSGRFQYVTPRAGIAALGSLYVGFGTGFLDLDHDGWEDLVIANGHVVRSPAEAGLRQRPVLLQNVPAEGQRRFRDVIARGGSYFQGRYRGRGAAIGDLDNDGTADLVLSHLNEPVVLLRGAVPAAPRPHWLGIELVGRDHRDVAGAKLVLEVAGRRLTRFAKGGSSYLSANDPRRLFGLGTAERVGRLTVVWPWSRAQHWENLPVDRYWQLVEGEASPGSAVRGQKTGLTSDRGLLRNCINKGTGPLESRVQSPC
ncbi:MAG: CRTAC1 family protein, partial [Gemmataceae bacterium]|nr:CRTAC1 family protein [Gemmataceae bacterium]